MAENETVDSSGLTFPIENLHEALIINIFQYLPVKDLKSLLLTNKYFEWFDCVVVKSNEQISIKILLEKEGL